MKVILENLIPKEAKRKFKPVEFKIVFQSDKDVFDFAAKLNEGLSTDVDHAVEEYLIKLGLLY